MAEFDTEEMSVNDLDAAHPVPQGMAVLDVREQDEWDAGHTPGAIHIPLSDLPTHTDELPEEDLLVVCRSGGRSGQASMWLNNSGFDARNLAGGLRAWEAAELPIVTDDNEGGYVK